MSTPQSTDDSYSRLADAIYSLAFKITKLVRGHGNSNSKLVSLLMDIKSGIDAKPDEVMRAFGYDPDRHDENDAIDKLKAVYEYLSDVLRMIGNADTNNDLHTCLHSLVQILARRSGCHALAFVSINGHFHVRLSAIGGVSPRRTCVGIQSVEGDFNEFINSCDVYDNSHGKKKASAYDEVRAYDELPTDPKNRHCPFKNVTPEAFAQCIALVKSINEIEPTCVRSPLQQAELILYQAVALVEYRQVKSCDLGVLIGSDEDTPHIVLSPAGTAVMQKLTVMERITSADVAAALGVIFSAEVSTAKYNLNRSSAAAIVADGKPQGANVPVCYNPVDMAGPKRPTDCSTKHIAHLLHAIDQVIDNMSRKQILHFVSAFAFAVSQVMVHLFTGEERSRLRLIGGTKVGLTEYVNECCARRASQFAYKLLKRFGCTVELDESLFVDPPFVSSNVKQQDSIDRLRGFCAMAITVRTSTLTDARVSEAYDACARGCYVTAATRTRVIKASQSGAEGLSRAVSVYSEDLKPNAGDVSLHVAMAAINQLGLNQLFADDTTVDTVMEAIIALLQTRGIRFDASDE